jgi:signal transduction histidine kinase
VDQSQDRTDSTSDIGDRLAAHPVFAGIPRTELEWLASHGALRRYRVGEVVLRKGQPSEHMFIQFSGRVVGHMNHASGRREQFESKGGEVGALLPFSRMSSSPADSTVTEEGEALAVHRSAFPEMIRECPSVVERLVHLMLDRAHLFSSRILRDEHLQSLGRLAAGLAHELNNPASAAARSSKRLREAIREAIVAASALGAARLTDEQRALVSELTALNLAPVPGTLSAIECVEREETFTRWLEVHGVDASIAEALGESAVSLQDLERLGASAGSAELAVMLRTVAADVTLDSLAQDVEQAADRVHRLVSAVAGFTRLDRGVARAPIDVAQGLADTVTMLAMKARAKSVAVHVRVDGDLPPVMAGDDLNHVWLQLLDNAIDGVQEAGEVHVRATVERDELVVRVIDDGPGIPADILPRIFDPFFTTKPPGKGMGLGLDIVRRVLATNDGHVSVQSGPGRTEFRVSLPVEAAVAAGPVRAPVNLPA